MDPRISSRLRALALLVFVISITDGIPNRAKRSSSEINAEIDGLIQQLTTVDADTKGIQETLTELKTTVSANPSRISQVSAVVKSVGSSLAKFKTGDPYNIVSGCLDILSSIATTYNGPYGVGLGAVASLLSSVIGLFAQDGFKNSLKSIVDEAFKRYRDEELQGQLKGASRTFNDVIGTLKNLTDKDTAVTDLEFSLATSSVSVSQFSNMLGIIESRINTGSTTTDLAEAKRTVDFIFLYLELAVMRETLLTQLILFTKKLGKFENYANGISASIDANKQAVHDTILFLHQMEPKNAVCGAYYYPVHHSDVSEGIFTFTRYFGLPDPPRNTFQGVYRVENRYWPAWHICKESYMGNHMFRGCSYIKSAGVHISALDNGYLKLNLKGKNMYITKHAQGWAWGTADNDPGEQGYFIFVPLKSGYYMISTKKWPNYFVYMESSASGYIRSWHNNPGLQGHWKLT
uniref:Toxin CfTX-B n=1 Tax=Chironex fleckeri TaxID=45396 RepID=JTX2B_CHIFL|nr:RecName: Full=Toxin CfTX-B; AltName: Full=Toxin B; Short=TX-B; Flags: Precursor [Chironex fleckeri]AFQ00677.1 toxin B precursor [Chironex fleckeri]